MPLKRGIFLSGDICIARAITLIARKYFGSIEGRLNQLKKGVNIEIFAVMFILDER